VEFVPLVVGRCFEQCARDKRLAVAEDQAHLARSVVEHGYSAALVVTVELPEPRVSYANPAFARLTGWSAAR
jgi:PAS domain-containing protein